MDQGPIKMIASSTLVPTDHPPKRRRSSYLEVGHLLGVLGTGHRLELIIG